MKTPNRSLSFIALAAIALFPLRTLKAAGETDLKTPQVVSATLKNGMKVLILERHNSPTVSFRMYFKVGSVNDPQGRTGLAHVVEHMLFKGTKTLTTRDFSREKPVIDKIEALMLKVLAEEAKGRDADQKKLSDLKKEIESLEKTQDELMVKDEYDQIYQGLGGEGQNAMTSNDYTGYLISLPSNQLEAWMIIESDRFKNPVLREFYRERNVIMEERRMRYESDPFLILWENFITHAFVAHQYHNETIGWMNDLKKLSMTDAENFIRSYYGPNNAAVAIVGDVKAKETLALMKKYFEPIPPRESDRSRITAEPPQNGERRVTTVLNAHPAIMIGYHKGDILDPDQPALECLRSVLASGRTSRFYKNLVEGRKVAVSVEADVETPGHLYPGLFYIYATPKPPHTLDELEQSIYAEIDDIKKNPISEKETEKVINQLKASLIRQMESNDGMAAILGYYETIAGDWQYPWKLVGQLQKVTPQDIQKIAEKYLTRNNRTVARLEAVTNGRKTEE